MLIRARQLVRDLDTMRVARRKHQLMHLSSEAWLLLAEYEGQYAGDVPDENMYLAKATSIWSRFLEMVKTPQLSRLL